MNLSLGLNIIVDLLFPRYCCSCGRLLRASEFRYLCDYCVSQICRITEPLCLSCGAPFHGYIADDGRICAKCRVNPPKFNRAISMWVFDGVARKIIHELKYKSGEYMLLDIERMVSQNKSFIELISSSVLVPVPIHWRRLFYRGYNQSELIAKMLCKITKNSTVRNLLIKKKHNRSQTELSSDNRVRNVAGSFALCKKIDLPKHVKIVIVDDVMTTGATVNECVKQFNEEGYYNLFVATLARD